MLEPGQGDVHHGQIYVVLEEHQQPPSPPKESLLSLDVAAPVLNDFKAYKELLAQIAETLDIEILVIQKKSHKLFDILNFSIPARIFLPINKGILELSKGLWQAPVTLPPTAKKIEKID